MAVNPLCPSSRIPTEDSMYVAIGDTPSVDPMIEVPASTIYATYSPLNPPFWSIKPPSSAIVYNVPVVASMSTYSKVKRATHTSLRLKLVKLIAPNVDSIL